MTFKVWHVWYQIEGFNTGKLFIILNFYLGLNWSKVIAKEGQKVIPTNLEGLDESFFIYVICGIELRVFKSYTMNLNDE